MSTARRDRTVPLRSGGPDTSVAGGWTAVAQVTTDRCSLLSGPRRPPVVEHAERRADPCSTPSTTAAERELAAR